jgi:uncharacterized protein YlaN (UPF0358 family)
MYTIIFNCRSGGRRITFLRFSSTSRWFPNKVNRWGFPESKAIPIASNIRSQQDATDALHYSAKRGVKMPHEDLRTCIEVLDRSKLKMISLSRCLFALRIYTIEDRHVKELLVVLKRQCAQLQTPFSAQAVGNSLNGLKNMSSQSDEARTLLQELVKKVIACNELLDAQEIGSALYGFQNMSSDSKEVRFMLEILKEKVANSAEPLDSQAVSMSLYGLQNMSSDIKVVRDLLQELVGKVHKCPEPLAVQEISMSFYGLQNMTSDSKEVCDLLQVLSTKVSECGRKLDAQAVGNCLFGLRGIGLNVSDDVYLLIKVHTIAPSHHYIPINVN